MKNNLFSVLRREWSSCNMWSWDLERCLKSSLVFFCHPPNLSGQHATLTVHSQEGVLSLGNCLPQKPQVPCIRNKRQSEAGKLNTRKRKGRRRVLNNTRQHSFTIVLKGVNLIENLSTNVNSEWCHFFISYTMVDLVSFLKVKASHRKPEYVWLPLEQCLYGKAVCMVPKINGIHNNLQSASTHLCLWKITCHN